MRGGGRRGRDASSPHPGQGGGCAQHGDPTLRQTCSRENRKSTICVQRFDDSLNSAIHTTYRSWLRSSSMREPRDPLSIVVSLSVLWSPSHEVGRRRKRSGGRRPAEGDGGGAPPRTTPKRVLGTVHRAEWPLGSVMILPQVHLRKPCYDFYFL